MKALAIKAAHTAGRVRASLKIGLIETVCPFDMATRLGIGVWFVNGASLEGIFTPDPAPTIIVSSQRPSGRQRFTCAHEIGHYIFEHGERIDEQSEPARSPEEFIANRFASALLMPKLSVISAFKRWGVYPRRISPLELFCVSQDLGVGYATLIEYMQRIVHLLGEAQSRDLLRLKPKDLRAEIVGASTETDVFVVDHRWGERPVDVQVGDLIKVQPTATHSDRRLERTSATLIRAASAGTTSIVVAASRDAPVRIRRRVYAGLARYRHLEDDDE